ncbi:MULTISPECIES: trypsin-like peptidase domain-containing protein [Burkholderia]|uniref:Probable periplasmic serine endoprotease DegP-like n=1 Tax=Burkholderia contaminans TaxID=488447 RepID=A0A2S5E7B3_9BURK|nr:MULTISPECIES: trypsin-like peptidase domain-containing protein [Burkholderia]EKS9793552.1 trypsin-like peptidase domain-containing protein [Burkholderia cepacia]EKS9801432.1 trypsin-like peptidase domain-containing protein [Burkholderia cepacia]EKS9808880.1 trypsin-like peptidase domain-containing protein [Burkholderia cepacia]EKS9816855.1 trypsin-like peptidase domain-containing protein [Burkholderia cepacia]EKS9831415.1 trypsin-like peptidase domain-containing protein [Burkholderia cepaci
MVRQTLARAVLRTALIGGVFAGCLPAPPAVLAGTLSPPVTPHLMKQRPAAAPYAMPVDFPAIVDRYGPAVVTVMTAAPDQQASGPSFAILDPDDPLAAFFRHDVPASAQGAPAQGAQAQAPEMLPRAVSGSGSGFIVSADGLILTSAHVVDEATDVTVRLIDRREFKATVLAVDPQSDVAVLRIDGKKLPFVRIGDSSKVRAGEPVMTIGAPDGSGNTVTAGIVSATSHRMPDGSAFPFFETDIAPNPDNSGGPVFNRAGDVIGIAVQVYTGPDRYASTTFAIPIAFAAKVRAQLQKQMQAQAQQSQAPDASSGNAIGVDVQDVGIGLAAAFGLPRPAGALVNGVAPGSPAAAAGVKPGDVIVKLGDKTIGRSAELNDLAAALPPGQKTPLRLIRNRAPVMLTITGADEAAGNAGATVGMAAPKAAARPAAGAAAADGGDRLGLTMHALSDDERRSTGLAVGMMVDAVHGPAAKAGIQPGDVVLELNDTLLETPDDIPTLEANGSVIAVLIQRNNARKFVSVRAR